MTNTVLAVTIAIWGIGEIATLLAFERYVTRGCIPERQNDMAALGFLVGVFWPFVVLPLLTVALPYWLLLRARGIEV